MKYNFWNKEDKDKDKKYVGQIDASPNQWNAAENRSTDFDRKEIILEFPGSTVRLPFAQIKKWYSEIIKIEEIGLVK